MIKSIVLGIVEGISEWLPISSTGHMILVNELINNTEGFTASDLYLYTARLIIVQRELCRHLILLKPKQKTRF